VRGNPAYSAGFREAKTPELDGVGCGMAFCKAIVVVAFRIDPHAHTQGVELQPWSSQD
jgi:hypothetical protein